MKKYRIIEFKKRGKVQYSGVIIFVFHLKFWNTGSIGIPFISLLDRLLIGLTAHKLEQLLDGIQIKHL